MDSDIDKEELVDWINQLEDQDLLQTLMSIKESHREGDWWDELPEYAKEGIERGEADRKAGRVHSREEAWEKIHRRRKNRK